MVYTCCVPKCNSGYRSSSSVEKIPIFRFPRDEELKAKWLKAIPRKNWKLSDSHRVCAKHFNYPDDFQTTSSDSNTTRRGSRQNKDLQACRLKPNAVPTVFAGLPKYLSSAPETTRSSSSSVTARLHKGNCRIEEANEVFMQQDVVETFSNLVSQIKSETLPSGYVTVICDENIFFHYISCPTNSSCAPTLLASVIVSKDLSVKAFIHSVLLPSEQYLHLLPYRSLKRISEILNILAFCKSCVDEENDRKSVKQFLNVALVLLEACADNIHSADDNCFNLPLLTFVTEQLKLMCVPKQGRRYSPMIITTSFLWQLTSSSLYKKLSELLILPSVRRLQTFLSGVNVNGGAVDVDYLTERTSALSSQEKIVTLIIDEVYTAQRVEYSNGSFLGLTDDGNPSKTVLAFMVQSTCSRYKDVVCLVPINKLDTATLRLWFFKVMEALSKIFFVLAVSVDNHICNRKLFMDLCEGDLKPSIQHPTRSGERLFLFFDFTHNFKNIYNCFLNKNRMHLPTNGFEHLLGDSCIAFFNHLKQLYALEEEKPLKIAHGLKKVSLNPSNLARISPMHALGVFSESTTRALEFYSKDFPEFQKTSKFTSFIACIWKIMSLKTPSKASRKRDDFCIPLSFSDGLPSQNVQFIREAIKIFTTWKDSGNAGLTNETFLACIQSFKAIVEITEYLVTNHRFLYVLPGKFSSDPLEGRFGWYRQVNGANFFMSVKQVFEAEKKIRVLTTMQQQGLLAACDLPGVNVSSSAARESVKSVESGWLQDLFIRQGVDLDQMSESDANIAYFVSGYIARSIVRQRKCRACSVLLVARNDVASKITDFVPENHKTVFEMANRGGLAEPTEFCFVVTAVAVQWYSTISSDKLAKHRLLSDSNSRTLFVSAVFGAINSSDSLRSLLSQRCLDNHNNFHLIVQSAFNCFAKNELKRWNAPQMEAPAKMVRTATKLTSTVLKK